MATPSELTQAVMGAVAERLQVLGTDVDAGVSQLHVLKASEEWLDLWGTVFGISRKTGELDDGYGPRLIEETIRQRPQPQALTDIVLKTTGVTVILRDLWPFVLHSDGFKVPAGRPAQVADGHLAAGWVAGAWDDLAVRSGLVYPYLEGCFGVWLALDEAVPFQYTLDNIVASLPLVLLADQFNAGSPHVSDGQLTTPDFGGPADTARHSFGVDPVGLPSSVTEVMSLITRHRAAGTEAVFMGFLS